MPYKKRNFSKSHGGGIKYKLVTYIYKPIWCTGYSAVTLTLSVYDREVCGSRPSLRTIILLIFILIHGINPIINPWY